MNDIQPHRDPQLPPHKVRLLVRKPGQEVRQIEASGRISVGRAFDNVIFVDETSASRYHALIEARPDGSWLTDLGSINGTTVNNEVIKSARKLKSGDVISLGGATVLEFQSDDSSPNTSQPGASSYSPGSGDGSASAHSAYSEAPGQAASSAYSPGAASGYPRASAHGPASVYGSAGPGSLGTPAGPREQKSTSPSGPGQPRIGLIIVAIAAPIAIIAIVAILLSGAFKSPGSSNSSGSFGSFGSSTSSYGPVHIIGVHTGDNITSPIKIRTDAPTTGDILQVIYQLDDVDLARVRVPPYEAELDPEQLATKLPGLAASNHVLSLIVEDKTGSRKLQPDKIVLSFNAAQANAAQAETEASPTESTNAMADAPGLPGSKDISYMANSLARQISKRNQEFSPEFVQSILLVTRDYRFNFADDARRYSPREIANAFSNKGLDPLLGFAIALSRSKFRPSISGDGEGLWLIPRSVLAEFAAGQDPASLLDPKRSAELAASYSKALLGLFDPEDFMYAIACFGMTTMQAGEIRSGLNKNFSQADRQDFWKVVNSDLFPKGSGDRVARFFAAGILGEYPDKFGLAQPPLSTLYY